MEYIQGNLIELFKKGKFTDIAHQCNLTSNKSFAGFANYLFKEFPAAIPHNDTIGNIDEFGSYDYVATQYGNIVNLYSQYYPGSPTNRFVEDSLIVDEFVVRLRALEKALGEYKEDCNGGKINMGLCLVGSGLAADRDLKGNMSDLEYFKQFVASIIEQFEDSNFKITVVYL